MIYGQTLKRYCKLNDNEYNTNHVEFRFRFRLNLDQINPVDLGPDTTLNTIKWKVIPMLHELKVTPKTIHLGHYDASLEPVLNVDSGDSIKINTLGLPKGHGTDFTPFGLTQNEIPPEFIRVLEAETPGGPGPHTLTGPIFVNDAKPQDVLEVEMLEIRPRLTFGYTAFRPGSGTIPERFPYSKTKIIRFDTEEMTAELPGGAKAPMKPFFGSIGVAPPPTSGMIHSGPPG